MDRLTPEKRSWNMSRIKSKDTTPERIVRSFLHRNGFRFRLHVKDLPGKPDIVLPKYKTVIEVRGCFWHQHQGCKEGKIPETRYEWWKAKLNTNTERDRKNIQALAAMDWKVLIIWQCFLKHTRSAQCIENTILSAMHMLIHNNGNTKVYEITTSGDLITQGGHI